MSLLAFLRISLPRRLREQQLNAVQPVLSPVSPVSHYSSLMAQPKRKYLRRQCCGTFGGWPGADLWRCDGWHPS